jgi:uncharacterized membrane protein YheB (UPF0754 family)
MPAALRLLSFPLLGGLIGWFTNWLAIRMLFRPRRPVRLFGFVYQGLIPKRKADLAHRMAEAITRDLVSNRDLADLLSRMDWEGEVRLLLEQVIEEDLKRSALSRFPVVGVVADNLLAHIHTVLTREITRRLESRREGIAERIGKRIDLGGLIRDKVNSFDLEYLETLVQGLVRRELRAIEILGGVLGFAIGSLHLIVEAFL